MKCIFCNRTNIDFDEKNCFTEEHIIPKALGNKDLILNCVCKECNSKLGKYIDSYFVDNMLLKLPRQTLGLKGQSGKIPNAFKEGKDENGNIVKVDLDFKPTIIPRVENEDNNGSQNIKIIAPDIKTGKKIAQKILKRNNVSESKVQEILEKVESTPIHSYRPTISYEFTIEPFRFYLEALKIAYEYMIFKVGDVYLNDETGRNIQDILNRAIKGEFEKSCPSIENVCLMPSEMYKLLSKSLPENTHFLIFHAIPNNKVVVDLSLFLQRAFSFSVLVSNNAEQYNFSDNIWFKSFNNKR